MNKPRAFLAAALSTALALASLGFSPAALAERGYAVAPNAKHQQECSSCHVAYPPGLLPARSWARIMAHLDRHYGTDASLDAASTEEIAAWLKVHAGFDRRATQEPPQDRISKSAWFVRQHDEVSASTWKRASIGSPANCSACHAEAGKGNFNEHQVRIPQ
jgi:nitrate/TMAO reductase-like tetraheme cytochrome c subunit